MRDQTDGTPCRRPVLFSSERLCCTVEVSGALIMRPGVVPEFVSGAYRALLLTSPSPEYRLCPQEGPFVTTKKSPAGEVHPHTRSQCFHCKAPASAVEMVFGIPWVKDHLIPRCRGGSSRRSNLVWSCHLCNELKRDHPVEVLQVFLSRFEEPPTVQLARLWSRSTSRVVGNAVHYSVPCGADRLREHFKALMRDTVRECKASGMLVGGR